MMPMSKLRSKSLLVLTAVSPMKLDYKDVLFLRNTSSLQNVTRRRMPLFVFLHRSPLLTHIMSTLTALLRFAAVVAAAVVLLELLL